LDGLPPNDQTNGREAAPLSLPSQKGTPAPALRWGPEATGRRHRSPALTGRWAGFLSVGVGGASGPALAARQRVQPAAAA